MGFLIHIVRLTRLQPKIHGNLYFLYCFEILCLWSSWRGPVSTLCISSADTRVEPSMSIAPASLFSYVLKTEPPAASFFWCVALCSFIVQITSWIFTPFIHLRKYQSLSWYMEFYYHATQPSALFSCWRTTKLFTNLLLPFQKWKLFLNYVLKEHPVADLTPHTFLSLLMSMEKRKVCPLVALEVLLEFRYVSRFWSLNKYAFLHTFHISKFHIDYLFKILLFG
jgi:hypothetical protein